MIPFPAIDPVICSLGFLQLTWYGLSYSVSFLLGYLLVKRQNNLDSPRPPLLSAPALEDLLLYCVLGVIIGGRLGYVLIYNPIWLLEEPLKIFKTWEGGMSFHGGLVGATTAIYILSRKYRISFILLADLLAPIIPIGLFFGRIANFINGELYGRVTDVPWSMIFPGAGDLPRHPSQLYEAWLEGLVLFILLQFLYHLPSFRKQRGLIAGSFLLFYAAIRIALENYRAPDAHIGFVFLHVTMGQLASIPMAVVGLYLITKAIANRKKL